MSSTRSGRPGAASLALLVILVVTAAWWALALWPVGSVEPEWLVRTRAACFGSAPGGLPDGGGWILLIGEPVGMVGALLVMWGGALREDFRRMRAHAVWRLAPAAVGVLALAGMVAIAGRVATAMGLGAEAGVPARGGVTAANIDVSGFVLTDQAGKRTSLAEFRGRSALLTFAYGHCVTVCPAILHELTAARAEAERPDVPLLIVVLDPWRDTPERLPALAASWKLPPGDRVLSGSVQEVERTLSSLGVVRQRDTVTGEITHLATVMVVSGGGRVIWRLDGGWGGLKELLALLPRPPRDVAWRWDREPR